jgi:hypothetical protein
VHRLLIIWRNGIQLVYAQIVLRPWGVHPARRARSLEAFGAEVRQGATDTELVFFDLGMNLVSHDHEWLFLILLHLVVIIILVG